MAKPTGEQLIKKAGKYHTAGKYAQAEKIYRQLLKKYDGRQFYFYL